MVAIAANEGGTSPDLEPLLEEEVLAERSVFLAQRHCRPAAPGCPHQSRIVHTLRMSQTTNAITIIVPTSPMPSIFNSPLTTESEHYAIGRSQASTRRTEHHLERVLAPPNCPFDLIASFGSLDRDSRGC